MQAYFAAKIMMAGIVSTSVSHVGVRDTNALPALATMVDSAGGTGSLAQEAVFRVFCSETGAAGTEFLNASGDILTAVHVVSDCSRLTGVVLRGSPAGAKII